MMILLGYLLCEETGNEVGFWHLAQAYLATAGSKTVAVNQRGGAGNLAWRVSCFPPVRALQKG